MAKKDVRDKTRSLRFTAAELRNLNKATGLFNLRQGLDISPSAYAVLCINAGVANEIQKGKES